MFYCGDQYSGFVSLLIAWGDTAMTGVLHASLCLAYFCKRLKVYTTRNSVHVSCTTGDVASLTVIRFEIRFERKRPIRRFLPKTLKTPKYPKMGISITKRDIRKISLPL